MVNDPKNKPADDEFDFDAAWGGSDNSTDAFGSDDTEFGGGFAGGTDNDPFASDNDPFGSGSDDAFGSDPFEEDDSFHSMPTPDNLSAEMEGDVDPDTDFGDLSSDVGSPFDAGADDDGFGGFDEYQGQGSDESFASQDGFDESENLFGDDASQGSFGDDEQGFAPQEDIYGESGAFDTDEQEADGAVQAAATGAAAGKSKGNLILAGGLAALLGIGYVGYSTVAPMFFGGGEEYTPVASLPPAPTDQFPIGLPGQEGGLPLSSTSPVVDAAPEVPVSVSSNDLVAPVSGNQLALPNGGPSLPPLPGSTDVNQAPSLALPSLGQEQEPSLSLPALPGVAAEEELIAGDRGGIDAMRDQQPVGGSSGSEAAVQALMDRLDALESATNNVNERLGKLEKVFSSLPIAISDEPEVVGIEVEESDEGTSFDEAPPKMASTTSSDGKPPLKPTIIDDMSLKGVSRGMAWVKTSNGVIEARVGDNIEGAGRVLGIKRYKGVWLAATENGLILQ